MEVLAVNSCPPHLKGEVVMTPSTHGLKKCVAITGVAVLALGGTVPTLAGVGRSSGIQIAAYAVIGNLVEATVVNPGDSTLSATIFVEAVTTGGDLVRASVPLRIEGGQKTFVEIPIAAPGIEEVIRFGVVLDDGSPF